VVTEFERRVITIRAEIAGHLKVISEITNLSTDGGDDKVDGSSEVAISVSRLAEAQFDAEVVAWESGPKEARGVYGVVGKDKDATGAGDSLAGGGAVLPSAEDSSVMSRYFPNKNPFFQLGSEDELAAIHANFTDSARREAAIVADRWAPVVSFLISSDGGCGKSELARHYCYAYKSNYKFIAWINASDASTILSSFKKCTSYIRRNHQEYYAKHFPISEAQRHSYDAALLAQVTADFVLRWLETLVAPWLLVVDNMGNASDLPGAVAFGSSSSSADDFHEHKSNNESSKLYILMRSLTFMLPKKCGQRILGHVLVTAKKDLRAEWCEQIPTSLYSASDRTAMLSFTGELSVQSIEHLFFSYLLESEVSSVIAVEDSWVDSNEAATHREMLETDIIASGMDLITALHMNPLAVVQALSAVREVRHAYRLHRPKQQLQQGQGQGQEGAGAGAVPRHLALLPPPTVSDYLGWMKAFSSSAEDAFSDLPDYAASYKSVLTTISAAMEQMPGIRIWSLKRSLEMLAFVSPHSIDLGLLQLYLRPPHTPLHVRILGKWRLPNMGLSFSLMVRLQEAEFEFEVESVFPLSIQNNSNSKRFKLRVFKNYAKIREAHDAMVKLYCPGASKLRFPSAILSIPTASNAEEAVSVRRAEISTFFKELCKCPCWGKLCTSRAVHSLFGILPTPAAASDLVSKVGTDKMYYKTDPLNVYLECRPEFLRLVSPLVSLSLISVTHSELLVPSEDSKPSSSSLLNSISSTISSSISSTGFGRSSEGQQSIVSDSYNRRLECSMSRCTQTALQMWLSVEGRYDTALNSTVSFLRHVLRAASVAARAAAASSASAQVLAQAGSGQGGGAGGQVARAREGAIAAAAADVYASKEATAICEAEYIDNSILPHALYVVLETPVDSSDFVDLAEECFARAVCSPAWYDQAELCCQRALDIIDKRGKGGSIGGTGADGAGSVLEAAWYVRYADILFLTSRQDKARALYEYALKVFRKAPPGREDVTAVLGILKKLGKVYYEDSRYKQAERVLEESIDLSRAVNALNPEQLAIDLGDYVTVMCSASSDVSTLELCLGFRVEELGLIKTVFGDKSLDWATCANCIGELQRRCGRSDIAKEWFEKTLDVLVNFGGGTHPHMTSALYNMALIYHAENQYDRAEKLYEKAIDIDRMHYGDKHVDCANIHDSLGILLCDQGHYDIGLDHLRTACDLYETAYGVSSRDTILSLNSLGYAYMKMGEPTLGISVYEKSLAALRDRDNRCVCVCVCVCVWLISSLS
jgi:tetratricopeptide (TPR) repeat protein